MGREAANHAIGGLVFLLLLAFCQPTYAQDGLYVELVPSAFDVQVDEGNVTLQCLAYNTSDYNTSVIVDEVEWFYENESIAVTYTEDLVVSNTAVGYANYSCNATDGLGNYGWDYTIVHFDELIVVVTADVQEASLLDNVTLDCEIYYASDLNNSVDMQVTWYTEKGTLGDYGSGEIQVSGTKGGKEEYFCKAVDGDGIYGEGSVEVEYITLHVEITASPNDWAYVGENITLTCRAYDYWNNTVEVEVVYAEWDIDDELVATTYDNEIFTISSDEAGTETVECQAFDGEGVWGLATLDIDFYDNSTVTDSTVTSATTEEMITTAEDSTTVASATTQEMTTTTTQEMSTATEAPELYVYVTASPAKAYLGDNVTLTCSVYNDTVNNEMINASEILWYDEDESLLAANVTSIKVSSNEADTLSYTCVAQDEDGVEGEGEVTVEFVIYVPPKLLIDIEASSTRSPTNSTVTLTCKAYNETTYKEVPIDSVVWMDDFGVIDDAYDTTLNVSSDIEGEETYYCNATDGKGVYGYGNITLEFSDYVPIEIYVELNANPSTAETYTSVNLTCLAFINSSKSETVKISTVDWYQDGQQVATTSSGTYSDTSTSEGTVLYSCYVTDEDGNYGNASVAVEFVEPEITTTPAPVASGIYPDTCSAGTGFSWVDYACVACDGSYEYNDGSSNVCSFCEYDTNQTDACSSSDGATTRSTNARKDICITLVLLSDNCSLSSSVTLTTINSKATSDARVFYLDAFPSSSGLCANDDCDNILVTAATKSNVCKSCTDNCMSRSFKSTFTACLYDVSEFVNTDGSKLYRRAEEVFLESFHNTTVFPAGGNSSLDFMDDILVQFPPTSVVTTDISDSENRLVVAVVQTDKPWVSDFATDTSSAYEDLETQMTSVIPSSLGSSAKVVYNTMEAVEEYTVNSNSYAQVTLHIVASQAVSSTLISSVAELLVKAHSTISGGSFGSTGISLQYELNVFESVTAQSAGTSAITWCDFLEDLSSRVSLTICADSATCTDSSLWYTCIEEDPTLTAQRELYDYGTAYGDSSLTISTSSSWYWYYYYYSETLYFSAGAPFGDKKHQYATVLPNGVITFGSPTRAWYPNLWYFYYYRTRYPSYSYFQAHILAPFWHYVNRYDNGVVYYQLYEKPSPNSIANSSANYQAVLDRAKSEVNETLGVTDFEPISALVCTWDAVKPYSWWMRICKYHERYRQYSWWYYYEYYYNTYCNSSYSETNTFQAVYVTDGQTSYAIVTYKDGAMNWVYDRYRRIEIGYVSDVDYRDFDYEYTDYTTKLTEDTFNTGRRGTWIEKVGEYESTDAKCQQFYNDNSYLVNNPTFEADLAGLYKCPCTRGLLGYQFTFYSWKYLSYRTYKYCYALGRKESDPNIQDNPYNLLCCYRLSYYSGISWREARNNAPYIAYPDIEAGHVLKYDPYWYRSYARESLEEDFNPRKWCCEESSSPSTYCALYNAVRPNPQCSFDVTWYLGRAMGDPHLTTLDGVSYTFNGKGEYIMVEIDDVDFMLQGRTDQAENTQGNLTSATVFVAFALKLGANTTFQVELDSNKTGMIIYANENDITSDFSSDANYTYDVNNLEVIRDDRETEGTVVSASFLYNIGIEVYVGTKNLEFSVKIPTDYKGKTKGLLGNFNDDTSDEFILPDGTQLTAEETDTEQEIFEEFGAEWEVTTSNTVFKYDSGESALTYQDSSWVPLFREDFNDSVVADAEQLCGGADAIACVYDYLATQDENFAVATLNASVSFGADVTYLTNNIPTLTLSSGLNSQGRWFVNEGESSTLQFSASDLDSADNVTFELVGTATGVSIDEMSGLLTYVADASDPVTIGVRASDSKSLSSPIYLTIVVCTGCSGNGSCADSSTRADEYLDGTFLLASCICFEAYEGEDCEEDVDGCADFPCGEDGTRNCTDIAASEQGNSTVGYTCGDCPDGYVLEDAECVDDNECIENGTAPVCGDGASCVNSIGSYTCTCNSGYREDSTTSGVCNDIDECAERLDNCEQTCNNLPGSYNCSCYGGADLLTSDNRTCNADQSCTKSCPTPSFCVNNGTSEICECPSGYTFADDACTNVDECTSGNSPCSQDCDDNDGSYTCSCYSGYTLSADGVTCEECEASYYGVNCASQCQCNGHGTCNSVKGCVCDDGYSGTQCKTDVDECATDGTCPAGQVCVNSVGSYTCTCPDGYEMDDADECINVDECSSVLLHNCDLAVEDCVDNEGSYSCACRSGYARDASNVCTDIDECTLESHDCEQTCENVEGSYNCRCISGYLLNSDRSTCTEQSDPCDGLTNLNCSYACVIDESTNQPTCVCSLGYGLVDDENCEDINECDFDHLNLCEYSLGCGNTDGGYNCTCPVGSYVDNDGRSCVDCGSGTWGDNCANSCNCDVDGGASCDIKYGCVCNTGFTGTYCEEDVNECTSGVTTCLEAETCVNTRGSSECQCISGYVLTQGSCQDLDECAVAANNDCDQKCTNSPGSYTCSCNSGYEWNGEKCEDIDECTIGLAQCEETCENSQGSYRCNCPDGMELADDGITCEVTVECTSLNCTDKCAVTDSVETCYCDQGRELNTTDNVTCYNIDYCADSLCEEVCTNTGTFFECSCPTGQYLEDNGYNCTECVEGTYGTDCSQTCVCNGATTDSCDKTDGTCTCLSGWEDDDCSTDIDECDSTNNCTSIADSTCENTPGSYVCKCNLGFYSSDGECLECEDFTYGENCLYACDCEQSSSTGCVTTTGTCQCESGYEGTRCDEDIDECLDATNDCEMANRTNWVCTNLPGSYECGCGSGYEDNNGTCEDLNECAQDYLNACDHNCTNTIGNYTCACNTGYSLNSDGRTCSDIDECTANTDGCSDLCSNDVGTFTCSCNSGRALDTDNLSCFEALEVASTITISGISAAGKNLKETAGPDFEEYRALIQPDLESHFSSRVSGHKGVIITAMREGSVVVDFTSTFNTESNPDAASQFVDMMVDMASTGLSINGTVRAVTVVIGNLTITDQTDKCTIMAEINACPSGSTCFINDDGSAECSTTTDAPVDDDDDDDLALIVGLAVGLPLGLLLIAAVAAAYWYKTKYKGQKRVNSQIGHYENQRTPSPDSMKNFRMDLPQSSLIDDPKN